MTQEEKAKRYDEAVKEASIAYKDEDKHLKATLERIFPELKESEDEKIRKELIDFVKSRLAGFPVCGRFIAWLKKQGEHSIYNVPSRNVILAIWDLGNKWKELTNGCISTEYGTQLDYIQKHWEESEYYLREKQRGNLVENGYTNNKDFIKYADNYSHEIWHKLMDNFKNIKDHHIGCNDVSDIVLNTIIDTCNYLEKQDIFSKKDVNDAYLKGVTDAKNEIEKQYEANYQIRKDIATFLFNYKGDIKDRSKWMDYLGVKVSFVEKQGEKPQGKSALGVAKKKEVDNLDNCGHNVVSSISIDDVNLDEFIEIFKKDMKNDN